MHGAITYIHKYSLLICLKQNGTAIDAVEAAVCELEESVNFHAGRGSLLNNKVEVECDAMIMDVKTLNTGSYYIQ